MKKSKVCEIEVVADWHGLTEARIIGTLMSTIVRGKEIFSFDYHPSWLNCSEAHNLDPSLHLLKGIQYAPQHQENFGIFLDSSPDRWGRFLMKRREALRAREEGREERRLVESDYLLGVYDAQRIGGLRFRKGSGPYLDNDSTYSAPPWTKLRELEKASLGVEKDDNINNPEYAKWIKMLIAPGGSLGGARPKAGVVDESGGAWIAKFPSRYDESNIGAWEKVVWQLAKYAGITLSEARIIKFNNRYHTFLSKRFDRTARGERIHYASAMTLLQHRDGEDYFTGVSYLELAEFIMRAGSQPHQDLEQLWRRIVFSMCVSNVDDHLRNHGFLLGKSGWALSPAFDINPNAFGNGLTLNVSETDNTQDLELALSVAEYFRIKSKTAKEIVTEIIAAVRLWRKEANACGISLAEQDKMAQAFRLVEKNQLH